MDVEGRRGKTRSGRNKGAKDQGLEVGGFLTYMIPFFGQ